MNPHAGKNHLFRHLLYPRLPWRFRLHYGRKFRWHDTCCSRCPERRRILGVSHRSGIGALRKGGCQITIDEPGGISRRRHLVEFRQGWVEMIPCLAAGAPGDHLRPVSAWIVQAAGTHDEIVGNVSKGHIDG